MTKECQCHYCGSILIRKLAPSIKTKLHFCNRSCKGEWQRFAKPVTKEWLEEHYVTKELNCTEIGYIVNRDPKSVWNWLKDFKIPTRPRGSDKNQHFKKGCRNGFAGRRHSEESRRKISLSAIASGRVPFDPTVGSYMKGRKGADTPMWKGGITPERQYFYASAEWKEAVKIVWRRTCGTCERCGIHQTKDKRGTYHIHHIVSFMVRHLRSDASNLVLLCKECHLFVHSKQNVTKEFIREVAAC